MLRVLRSFLEDELARRYRDAAPATLALLTERCAAMARELVAVDGRLAACSDVAALRRAGGWAQGLRGFVGCAGCQVHCTLSG